MEKAAEKKLSKKRKMKVDKRRKMITTTKVDSCNEGFLSMISRRSNREMDEKEEEERITLMEFYRRMKKTKKILGWRERRERRKGISASLSPTKAYCDGFSDKLKLSKSDEGSDSEEEGENVRRSPVEIKGFSYYFDTKVYGDFPENEPESDEEVLGDSDRDEIDRGFKFVVKKRWRTVTNPKVPDVTYFKSDGSESISIFPVLHDPDFPLAALSKLALKTYNTIQNTEYRYVGLVKAYKRTVNGFFFWTRFKACLPGQDPINFQALTLQKMLNRKTNVVPVQVESVYPLPPS